MKEKACANIEAAKLLASHALFDSAASRAYYSVYLMAWYYVGLHGFYPSSESIYSRRTIDGSHYWKHYEFPVFLNEAGFIGPVQMEKMEVLRQSRTKADYYSEESMKKRQSIQSESLMNSLNSFQRKRGGLNDFCPGRDNIDD